MRAVIFRCDRIGDVVNSLPVAHMIKEFHRDAHVTFVTCAYAHEVAALCPDVDCAAVLEGEAVILRGNRFELRDFVKNVDLVCCLFVHAKTAYHIWRGARHATIVGPWSKWYSWVCYPHGKRQHRSTSVKHETEYNQELLPFFEGTYLQPKIRSSVVHVEGESVGILWHPESAGTPLRLTPRAIIDVFAQSTPSQATTPILFCGTPAEQPILTEIVTGIQALGDWPVAYRCFSDLKTYVAAMLSSVLWVGPSTGPMHIAAALDVPVMTYFSPVRVHHPRRWGPYATQGVGSSVWMPLHPCPGYYDCLREKCRHYARPLPVACLHALGSSGFLEAVFDTAQRLKEAGKTQKS